MVKLCCQDQWRIFSPAEIIQVLRTRVRAAVSYTR